MSLEKVKKEMREEEKKKFEKDISKNVLTSLAMGNKKKSTELIVYKIKSEKHIYTTRNDDKAEMWIYHEGIYIPQARTFIKEYCRDMLDEAYTPHLANQVIAKIEADTYIDMEEFFNKINEQEIAVKNGIINIFTKELRCFSPKHIFFNKIPVTFDPGKKPECIIKHFKEVLKEEEDINVMQEIFGYLLFKKYPIEKAFMFIGEGRNGKSKTLELMKEFLGAENCSNISLEEIETEGNNFIISELFQKLANLASDISSTALKKTGKFKQLTGGDTISAQRKFLPMIYFKNYAKMIFCANQLPRPYDITNAFWNRWVVFEFPFTFISRKEIENQNNEYLVENNVKIADPQIIDKMTTPEEMSGLLNWALEGLIRLIKQRDFSYSKNTEQVKDLWLRNSNSFLGFMKEFVVEDYDCKINKKDLRNFYSIYCKLNKLKVISDRGIKSVLLNQFGVIDSRNYEDGKPKGYVWEGIRFDDKISGLELKNSTERGTKGHTKVTTLTTPFLPCVKKVNKDNGQKGVVKGVTLVSPHESNHKGGKIFRGDATESSSGNLGFSEISGKCVECGVDTISDFIDLCPNCSSDKVKIEPDCDSVNSFLESSSGSEGVDVCNITNGKVIKDNIVSELNIVKPINNNIVGKSVKKVSGWSKKDVVFFILNIFEKGGSDFGIYTQEIFNLCFERFEGISEVDIFNVVCLLKREGELFEPKNGYLKMI